MTEITRKSMSWCSTVQANDLCSTRLFSERHLENQIFTGNYRGGRMELGDKSMHWSERKVAGECNFPPSFVSRTTFFVVVERARTLSNRTTTVLCVRLKQSIRSSSSKANYDQVYGRLGIMDPFLNQILKEKAEQNHATTIHQKAKEQRPPQFGARPRPHKISCCPRTCTHTHK